MREVEARKVVTLRGNLTVGNVRNATLTNIRISIPFIPDEMVVRSICYKSVWNGNVAATLIEPGITQLACPELTGSDAIFLGYIQDQIAYCPETRVQLRKPVDSSYTFYLINSAGSANNVARAGDLAVDMEFLKFKPSDTEERSSVIAYSGIPAAQRKKM